MDDLFDVGFREVVEDVAALDVEFEGGFAAADAFGAGMHGGAVDDTVGEVLAKDREPALDVGKLPLSVGELVANMSPNDLMFPARGGGVMRNKNARRDWFDPAVLELFPPTEKPEEGKAPVPSVNFTPHDLRHTAASIAISRGANVKAIQRMLGHATASMTLDTYGHLFDDELDDVAARIDPFRKPPGAVVDLAERRASS